MIVFLLLDFDFEIFDFFVDFFCFGFGIFLVDFIFELEDLVMYIKGNKRFLCNVFIFLDILFLIL